MLSLTGRSYIAPPLGLVTLAAATPEDVEVSIADENLSPVSFDVEADLVGITSMTSSVGEAYRIADGFRQKGRKVVLGGFHVSYNVEEALLHADAVAVGEADRTWPVILADAANGHLQPVYRDDEPLDLETLKLPRWDLIRHKAYAYHQIQITRGCPHNCSFCCVHELFGRRSRHRKIEDVVAELQMLSKIERKLVFICDDNLLVNRRFADELLDAIRPLGINWHCQTSLEISRDGSLLDRMAESGCKAVFVGMETLDETSLDLAGKRFNRVVSYKEAVDSIQARGIAVLASFIVGLPGESPSNIQRIADFVQTAKPLGVMLNIFTPLPGTRSAAEADKDGRILTRNWSQYDARHAVSSPGTMTAEEVESAFDNLNREVFAWDALLDRFRFFVTRRNRNQLHSNHRRKKASLLKAMAIIARVGGNIAVNGDWMAAGFAWKLLTMSLKGESHLSQSIAMLVQGIDWNRYAKNLSNRPIEEMTPFKSNLDHSRLKAQDFTHSGVGR